MNGFPEVMRQAREDLSANVSGQFSPDDWERILTKAHAQWQAQLRESAGADDPELAAWRNVILDFNRNRYWGFEPSYVARKDPTRKKNLGISFLWIAFQTLTITKVAIAWFGQVYSRSDEPVDAYLFFVVLALIVANFAIFLWRTRHFKD